MVFEAICTLVTHHLQGNFKRNNRKSLKNLFTDEVDYGLGLETRVTFLEQRL
jgi:hypothetical protein